MTLEELIRRFRVLAKDNVTASGGNGKDLLWSDEDITDWLNDAQAQACVRGRLIREDANPTVCRIALNPAQHTYLLHGSVYEIINLRLVPAVGGARTVRLKSREWLDAREPRWRDLDVPVCWAIQNDTTIRVVGRIDVGDALELECYRLPMKVMSSDRDTPEIHVAHHEHLILWALHKAFSVPDADAFDPNRSALSEAAFTTYFGPPPDSDLRRSTREDEVQTTAVYMF